MLEDKRKFCKTVYIYFYVLSASSAMCNIVMMIVQKRKKVLLCHNIQRKHLIVCLILLTNFIYLAFDLYLFGARQILFCWQRYFFSVVPSDYIIHINIYPPSEINRQFIGQSVIWVVSGEYILYLSLYFLSDFCYGD